MQRALPECPCERNEVPSIGGIAAGWHVDNTSCTRAYDHTTGRSIDCSSTCGKERPAHRTTCRVGARIRGRAHVCCTRRPIPTCRAERVVQSPRGLQGIAPSCSELNRCGEVRLQFFKKTLAVSSCACPLRLMKVAVVVGLVASCNPQPATVEIVSAAIRAGIL